MSHQERAEDWRGRGPVEGGGEPGQLPPVPDIQGHGGEAEAAELVLRYFISGV